MSLTKHFSISLNPRLWDVILAKAAEDERSLSSYLTVLLKKMAQEAPVSTPEPEPAKLALETAPEPAQKVSEPPPKPAQKVSELSPKPAKKVSEPFPEMAPYAPAGAVWNPPAVANPNYDPVTPESSTAKADTAKADTAEGERLAMLRARWSSKKP